MSKSVLVIDTPKNCTYCPLCFYTEIYSEHQCRGTECTNSYSRTITEYGEEADRPDWCPLSPLPPHKDLAECVNAVDVSLDKMLACQYAQGWNELRNEILKGEAINET